MPKIMYKDVEYADGTNYANEIQYDNSTSGLSADNVQSAIDEVNTILGDKFDTSNYYVVTNASGSYIGDKLGSATYSPKPIFVIDPANPSYYWFGVYWYSYGSSFIFHTIANSGLTASGNAYGSITLSGGSGSYTFVNLIPKDILI